MWCARCHAKRYHAKSRNHLTEPSNRSRVSSPGPISRKWYNSQWGPLCVLEEMSAEIQNTANSSVQRRDSVKSWTGSEIFRPTAPNNVDVSQQNDDAKSKLSGKAWGRVKKFLLCKTGFPSSIYYIVGNEFCERFSYYGMKAILILYLTRVLSLGDNTATAVFHSFSMLCYFTPLFGAMLADGWLGKYRWVKTIQISFTPMASLSPPAFAGYIWQARTLKHVWTSLHVRDGLPQR